jgi:hypothetical protein
MAVNRTHPMQPADEREKEKSSDHSLRAYSLKRATLASVPRTLTPYEWEQWYAQYGVPESHIVQRKVSSSWWRRLFKRQA